MKKITFLVAALFATMMANATSVTLTMKDIAATKGEKDGVSFTTAQNDGATAPAYNTTSNDLRLYAKNTITIAYTENIKSISFAISTKGQYRLASLTADNGTCTVKGTPDFTAVWSGDANTVTITVGDKADYGTDGNSKAGQLCFDSFTVSTEESTDGDGGEDGELTVNYAQAWYFDEYSDEGEYIWQVDLINATSQTDYNVWMYIDLTTPTKTKIAGTWTTSNGLDAEYSGLDLINGKDTTELSATDVTLTLACIGTDEEGYAIYSIAATMVCDDGKTYTAKENLTIYAADSETEDDIILDDEVTAIRSNIEVLTDVYAREGRIYAEDGAQIYTIMGLNVTEQNQKSKLGEGIYIVKAGNKVAKIVVK